MVANRINKRETGSAKMVWEYPFTPAQGQSHTEVTDLSSIRTVNTPKGVSYILVQALTQNIRYTLDGTNPTTSSGFRLTAGNDPLLIPLIATRSVLKFIEETSGAVLEYQYGE